MRCNSRLSEVYKETIPTPYGDGSEKTESATRRGHVHR